MKQQPVPQEPTSDAMRAAENAKAAYLEWVEATAKENLLERRETYRQIKREAETTFTVVAAGIGGSFALASKVMEPGSPDAVAVGAAVMCVHLGLVAAFVVSRCLQLIALPVVTNEPGILLADTLQEAGLLKVKGGELRNMQERIDDMRTINARAARNLNRARVLALLAPVSFVLAAVSFQPSPGGKAAASFGLECTSARTEGDRSALACHRTP